MKDTEGLAANAKDITIRTKTTKEEVTLSPLVHRLKRRPLFIIYWGQGHGPLLFSSKHTWQEAAMSKTYSSAWERGTVQLSRYVCQRDYALVHRSWISMMVLLFISLMWELNHTLFKAIYCMSFQNQTEMCGQEGAVPWGTGGPSKILADWFGQHLGLPGTGEPD